MSRRRAARCVLNALRSAITPGAVRKIRLQLPEEFQPLLGMPSE